jgi:putative sterol carrier protein
MTDINADQVTPEMVFERMPSALDTSRAGTTNATIQFDLSGESGGKWWVKIHDGKAESGKGDAESPNLTITMDARDYVKMSLGQLDGTQAFMTGKLKIKGDMGLAIKMQTLFRRPEGLGSSG